MRIKMQIKMIDQKTLVVHFIEGKPNIRGERFRLFVEKLQKILGFDLNGVRIILSPLPLKESETIELSWTRFDESSWKLKDFIAT